MSAVLSSLSYVDFSQNKGCTFPVKLPYSYLIQEVKMAYTSQSHQFLCLSEWDYCFGLQKMLYLFTFELSTDHHLLMVSLQKGGGGSVQINHKRHASSA